MTTQRKRELDALILKGLKRFRERGPICPRVGICKNIEFFVADAGYFHWENDIDERLYALLGKWPESTTPAFPIEGSWAAYSREYGKHWENPKRMELVHWLIDYLEKKNAESQDAVERVQAPDGASDCETVPAL
jgi:hypothetical protein